MINLINRLKEYGVNSSYVKTQVDDRFAGKTFVLTGTLPTLKRDEAKALIEKGEKGIFFINSAEKAYDLYKDFKQYAVFNCSRQHKLHVHVNDEEIAWILKNE